ncbi:uncharacterized protein LOC124169605 [Ischnura elegans]|uniref:uncharacterized protein LOC124169605 n=1 Tax=Ischnura elegans TaxID=197161 RepID=UPI001ED8758A|nr:uncharacterized protein LOC124169605 [Ischnura elegans]
MLKLVILSALLAVVAAAPAPQYPIFSPYPFPFYHHAVPVPYATRTTAVRPSIVPIPYYVPFPYHAVEAPSPVVPEPSVATKTAHPQVTKATFRVPGDVQQVQQHVQPKPVQTYTPQVSSFVPPKDFSVEDDSLLSRNPSLQLADLILTPEQKRQLEEAVAAMNPLEFAARLEANNGNAREAMRIFSSS